MRRSPALVLTLTLIASVLALVSTASATPPGDTPDTGSFYVTPEPVEEGQSVKLTGNFPSGSFTVTFYKQTAPDAPWEPIGSRASNSYGNAYVTDYTVNGPQTLYARITSGGTGRTEEKTITPTPPAPVSPGPDVGSLSTSPTTYAEGDTVSVTANFASGSFAISLYKETTPDTDTWTKLDTKQSNSSGNATFSYVVNGTSKLFARKSNGDSTEVDPIAPTPKLDFDLQRDCTGTNCAGTATARGTTDPAQVGRVFKLQYLNGSTWTQVGSQATSGADGKVQIQFALDPSKFPQWSTRSFRLVSAGAPSLTSLTIKFIPGPTQLGTNVLRVDVDKGIFPTTRGPEYTGDATLSVNGDVNPILDNVALEHFGVRGNSSTKFPKLPYKLKFLKSPKNTTVFGMSADKSWTLLPNFVDQTFIRDKVGLDLGRRMTNIAWTPDSRLVEVFVNDQYRGLYTMTESVKIDGDRLDIDAEAGMIMETDGATVVDSSLGFLSTKGKIAFAFKDPDEYEFIDGVPDPESVTGPKLTAIKNRVNAFETMIYGSSTRDQYPDFIDVDSAIDFYLVKEFTRDNDTDFYRSHYFSWNMDPTGTPTTGHTPTPLDDGKFHFGPAWDFDRSAGNISDTDSTYVSSPIGWSMRGTGTPSGRPNYATHWFVQLFETSTFNSLLEARWEVIRGEFEKVHLTETAALKAAVGVSAASDRKRWAGEPKRYASRGTYDQEIAYVTKWYKDRFTWMDGQLTP